jgi:hypothetical protein
MTQPKARQTCSAPTGCTIGGSEEYWFCRGLLLRCGWLYFLPCHSWYHPSPSGCQALFLHSVLYFDLYFHVSLCMAMSLSIWQYADERSETLVGTSGYSLRESTFYGVSHASKCTLCLRGPHRRLRAFCMGALAQLWWEPCRRRRRHCREPSRHTSACV